MFPQQVLKPNGENPSPIAYTFLRLSSRKDWYFDNGYSKHWGGEKNYMKDIQLYSNSYVTFGDGAKGKIRGKEKLDCLGLPCLDDMLLIKGLISNIINISQHFGQYLNVNFSHSGCTVINKHQVQLMKGSRLIDNCYMYGAHKKIINLSHAWYPRLMNIIFRSLSCTQGPI